MLRFLIPFAIFLFVGIDVCFGQAQTLRAQEPEQPNSINSMLESSGLKGRWIVRAVKVDGEVSKAQIGQQPGDIIDVGLKPMAIT